MAKLHERFFTLGERAPTELKRLAVGIAAIVAALVTASATNTVANEPASQRGLGQISAPDGGFGFSYSGSHALLIGAADYSDPSWADLPRIPSELAEIEAALTQRGFIVERLNDPSGAELRSGLRSFLAKYGRGEENKDNRLLIFYSGHGYSDDNFQGYLVPTDAPNPTEADEDFIIGAVDMSEIVAWAGGLVHAKHVLFLFDSCFAGTVFESRSIGDPGSAYIAASTSKPVRQFITAGDADQEVPAQSVFAPEFVDAIDGAADTNNDGYVTGLELGVYLSLKVPSINPLQTPRYGKIRDARLDDGDFVFQTPAALANAAPAGTEIAALAESSPPRLVFKNRIKEGPPAIIYTDADAKSRSLGFLEGATEVAPVAQSDDGRWVRVALAGAREGWVFSSSLGLNPKARAVRDTQELPPVLFDKTFGGTGTDKAFDVIARSGGGFYVSGYTASKQHRVSEKSDGWIVALDSTGEVIWERAYGGEGEEIVDRLLELPGGDILGVGATKTDSAGEEDVWVVRISDTGELIWEHRFGGAKDDRGFGASLLPDGTIIIAAHTESKGAGQRDIWLVQIDSDGEIAWDRTYGTEEDERIHEYQATTDGGFLLAGSTKSPENGSDDLWIIKADRFGEVLWERTYGGPGADFAYMQLGANGMIGFAGYSQTEDPKGDGWVMLLDEHGDLLWEKFFGGPHKDDLESMIATASGSWIVFGYTEGNAEGATDGWVFEIDSRGNVLWDRRLHRGDDEKFYNAVIDTDGGIVLAGYSSTPHDPKPDYWVRKIARPNAR